MSSQIAQLEEDKSQYQEQLDLVIQSLRDDPGNAELLALKEELDTAVQLIDESIAELKPPAPKAVAAAAAPPSQQASPPAPPPAAKEKWSRENHPAFRKDAAAAAAPPAAAAPEEDREPAAAVSYRVNDTVLAKWVSGDKGFYPARITSVTGSAAAPMYTVRFKSYDNVETLRSKDVRPIAAPQQQQQQKRKADGSATPTAQQAVPAPPLPPQQQPSSSGISSNNNGVVTSAAASLYPEALQQKGEGKDGAEPPAKKFKKIKATKELEKGKNKWQEFSSKSKFGKTHKKESMFRTPEGVHGRVGFTGSGQEMRKDPTRSRHIYQPNEEMD